MTVRQPAVSGMFYPGSPHALNDQIAAYLTDATEQDAKCIIMPHAGYIYSGTTAGQVVSKTRIPDTVVLLGPKHTGLGEPFAISNADAWRTPLGEVPIDKTLVNQMLESGLFAADDMAHIKEHSLEVELPFLQAKNPAIHIVPIALAYTNFSNITALAQAITKAIAGYEKKVLIVASTDMSHQLPIEVANRRDHMAIEKIKALDPEGLFRTVTENDISMCGIIPVTTALLVCKATGSDEATLISYTTSADASGDTSAVVGYAGFIIR